MSNFTDNGYSVANDRSSAAGSATLALLLLNGLLVIQGALAYWNQFLTVSQMKASHIDKGLPFVWHFGMWGDFIIISPLASYLIGCYVNSWKVRRTWRSIAIGLFCASVFSWMYTLSPTLEAHVQNHRLTPTGIVHLFYMGVTIAVFAQFFMFTPNVPRHLIKTVSLLVLLHVFFGMHMALGILSTLKNLDWYPGQPLKSIIGWSTILGLSIAMYGRYTLTRSDVRRISEGTAKRTVKIFMWLQGKPYWDLEDVKKPVGLLTFLDSAGGSVLQFAFFLTVAGNTWRRFSCQIPLRVSVSEIDVGCLVPALLAAVLVGVFGIVFFLSKHSSQVELELVPKVFPENKVPDRWGSPRTPFQIIISSVCFFLLYMALAWSAYDVRIASLLMLVISVIDFNTRRLINGQVGRYFSDATYAPDGADPKFVVINARRTVLRRHLFEKPYLRKEAARAAGCAFSLAIAFIGYHFASNWVKWVAYLVLLATLVLNEIVTQVWRRERDRELLDVERRHLQH